MIRNEDYDGVVGNAEFIEFIQNESQAIIHPEVPDFRLG